MTTDTFAHLPLQALVSSPTNPRTIFDAAWITELAESIKPNGVIQPILVRPLPGSRVADTARGVTHEIVEGECRWRGSVEAGLSTIPAMIKELTDLQAIEIQLLSFLKRKDLTALEEAQGYRQLMTAAEINADEVANRIHKSRSYVFGRLKLLDLCTEARKALREDSIDASRALLLARIPDHKLQIKALGELTVKSYTGDAQLGYRAALAMIQRDFMLRLDAARFKITDATLLPSAGSCKTCAKRTGHDPDLFADVKGADVCTDPPCFHRKDEAHTAQMLATAQANGQTVIAGREAKALMPNHYGGIDGYLRLDDATDSPTDKPLRKLIGKQIESEGIQPTLIANPHKEGDLIAVLPKTQVAELLKATQHQEAAERVTRSLESCKTRDAEAEKIQAKKDFEQGWRTLLLERTWAAIKNDGEELGLTDKLLRHLALHYATAANTDRAKRLCQILDLGKVAPKAALVDHINDTDNPEQVLQLLIMQADVEYLAYMTEHYPDCPTNVGLLLVADRYGIDVESVKSDIKAKMRGTDSAKAPGVAYRGPNGETWSGRGLKPKWVTALMANGVQLESLKVPAPLTPAAQAQGVLGGKKSKTSAAQAQAQIAAALQAQDTTPGAAAQGIAADSSQPVATPGASAPTASQSVGAPVEFEVGQRVCVTTDDNKLGRIAAKWGGKVGTVTQREPGGGYWNVTFKGRGGGIALFAADQIELVQSAVLPESAVAA